MEHSESFRSFMQPFLHHLIKYSNKLKLTILIFAILYNI